MSNDDDNVIDVEAEEIVDSENLPAVIPKSSGTHESTEPITQDAAGPSPGRDWSTYSRPERRCTAHSSRTGEQCKNVAIKGHTVCRYHGGAAKQIKRAAQTRLDNAAEVMAKQLLGLAMSADSEGVMLAAVKDALDRTIGKAPTTVVIGPTKPYEELFEGIAGGTRAESRRARGVPDSDISSPAVDSTEDRSQPIDYVYATDGGSEEQYTDTSPATAADAHSSPAPPREPRPRQDDRSRRAQRPQRHISGMEAIREANEANRQIGALKAIESPHRRYKRPG